MGLVREENQEGSCQRLISEQLDASIALKNL